MLEVTPRKIVDISTYHDHDHMTLEITFCDSISNSYFWAIKYRLYLLISSCLIRCLSLNQ